MPRIAYRLIPKEGSGFHFGREGRETESSMERMPSDSFFAALVVAHRDRFGEVETFLEPWVHGEPPFVLSSLFPFVGELPLLPMPRLRILFTATDPANLKALKSIQYVSPKIMAKLLRGDAMDHAWQDGPRLALQQGAIWIDADEQALLPEAFQPLPSHLLHTASIWHINAIPRVTVHRVKTLGNIFHVGRTVFAPQCGLWFLADLRGEPTVLNTLLGELSMSGIGGERNSGHGAFTVGSPLPEPQLPAPQQSSRLLTLSRYSPRLSEIEAGILGDTAAYELVKVGGWLNSRDVAAQRRRRVFLLEAGSVLDGRGAGPVLGKLVNVRPTYTQPGAPPHPVYRNGFALPVGVGGG